MTATTQTRPRLWPLGVAVAACLFFAMMFLAGGGSAHSATPHANAPYALATDVTNTVVVTQTVQETQTQIVLKTSFVPFTITQTANVTNTFNKTNTNVHNVNVTNTRNRTVVNHVNSTAFLNFNVTNTQNVNVLQTKQITKPVDVTNSVFVTNTAQETQTALQTVEVQSASKSKPLADRARLAIGAGGVAVTSAAGFGFLMLRRRGRYTS